MRDRRLSGSLAAGSLVLALTVGGVWAQNKPGALPIGAGAIGREAPGTR